MTKPSQILIIDTDAEFAGRLRRTVERLGIKVRTAQSISEALNAAKTARFEVVVFEGTMETDPANSVTRRLAGVSGISAETKFVVTLDRSVTGESAGGALLHEGISDFIVKPMTSEEAESAAQLLAVTAGQPATHAPATAIAGQSWHEPARRLVGSAPSFKSVLDLAKTVAGSTATVLLLGETGTGKELVARYIHFQSIRRDKRFVAVNCGALSESLLESELFGHERGAFTGAVNLKIGKFEYAAGGTIFLDEIGEISPHMQVRLLKALETGEVERVGGNVTIKTDPRIIAATNKPLAELVNAGKFRDDLFYRLNVFPIRLPPLRERKEDIPSLASHFLKIYAEKTGKQIDGISPAAMAQLANYDWPGNIRELENIIERSVIMTNTHTLERIISGGAGPISADAGQFSNSYPRVPAELADMTFREFQESVVTSMEKEYFIELLRQSGGRLSIAAQTAGIDRKTLYRKLAEHGLAKEMFKSARKSGGRGAK